MATTRITIRTIDYHKFRSLVIERDSSAAAADELRARCDGDVARLCDAVRRLYDRRQRFHDDDDDDDDSGDLARFGEICGWYKLILESRRVRALDVRLRSGWWEVGASTSVCRDLFPLRQSSLPRLFLFIYFYLFNNKKQKDTQATHIAVKCIHNCYNVISKYVNTTSPR